MLIDEDDEDAGSNEFGDDELNNDQQNNYDYDEDTNTFGFESDGFANAVKPVIVNGRGQVSSNEQGTEQLSPPLQNLQ